MAIGRVFGWLAGEHPEAVAVQDDERSVTWAELDRRTNRLARAYGELGVGLDSVVTVALPNSVEFVEVCVALWKAGATPQPMSPRLSRDEQRGVLELARPALVVGLPAPAGESPAATSGPGGGPRHLAAGFEPSPALSDDELPQVAAGSWKAPTSSGSTGHPKLVFAIASAHIDPEGRVAEFVPRRAVQLVSGPLHHSAPFTYAMRGLMTGHSLVILPRFDERRWLDAIGRHGVTWAPVVPTMMNRVWRLPEHERAAAELGALESILHIGAPCPTWLKRAYIDWLGPDRVVEVYAGTESQGLTTITGAEWLQHPGSVGRPTGGTELRVVGADARPLPPGQTGLVQMRRTAGPTYRYRTHADAPAAQPAPGAWDTLGDLGHLDAEGFLYLADRAADLIITGGVNVYPAEVEAVLEQHPGIRSAVVFGMPDDDLGEYVHALVDVPLASDAFAPLAGDPSAPLAGGASAPPLDEAALLAWVRGRIDPEKRPRRIEVVHDPLRDDAGKVRRHLLRAARLPST